MLNADDVVQFLRYCEQQRRPRTRLCEQISQDGEEVDYTAVFQQLKYTGEPLGLDESGMSHVKSLVRAYNRYVGKKENVAATGVWEQE